MKRLSLFALAWLIVSFALSAADKTPRIAVIDVERIFTQLSHGQTIRAELSAALKDTRKRIETTANDINRRNDRLKNDSTLSETARKELQMEVEYFEQELAEIVTRENSLLLQKEDEITQTLLRDIYRFTEVVAKRKKFDIVLEKRQAAVLFATTEFDITNEVYTLVNAETQRRGR